jgi:hypothetical protein
MKDMKRLFQFGAFALALLVAALPLLADAACTQQPCGGAPNCSMHVGGIAIPDSAMRSLLASTQATPQAVFAEAGCSYGSCSLQSERAALLMATPPIFRFAGTSTLLMPVAPFSASREVVLTARPSEDPAPGAVPMHILFQVFRI